MYIQHTYLMNEWIGGCSKIVSSESHYKPAPLGTVTDIYFPEMSAIEYM